MNSVLIENISNYSETDDIFEMLRNSNRQEMRISREKYFFWENILKVNKLLKQSKFVHKTSAFKRLDRELFKMMVKLDDIDVEENTEYREERKLALMKIHDMNKLLDSKVKCKLDDCIVYKTGIEVK